MPLTRLVMIAIVATLALAPSRPAAAGTPAATAFTYQGSLSFEGSPYTGAADYRFSLWDAPAGGGRIADIVHAPGTEVVGGLFAAGIDFGAEAHGPGRFLQIEVRTPAWDGAGAEPDFFVFPQRTHLTASPYALSTRGITVSEAGDRVGIGAAEPTHALHVAGPRTTMLVESPSAAGTWLNLRNTAGGRFWSLISTGLANPEGPGNLVIGHGLTANSQIPLITLTNAGNIGIGTASPQRRLDVVGNVRFGGNNAVVELGNRVVVAGGLSVGTRIDFPDGSRQETGYRPIIRDVYFGASSTISPGGQIVRTVTNISGARPGMTVIVNPPYRLWPFHIIGYAYVESPGQVAFSIVSTGGPDRVYGPGDWRITVLP